MTMAGGNQLQGAMTYPQSVNTVKGYVQMKKVFLQQLYAGES